MNNTPFTFRRIALDQGSLELTEEYIRLRAYEIWERRGRQDGHDVEDWLQAEAEIFGRRSAKPDQQEEEKEAKRAIGKSAA